MELIRSKKLLHLLQERGFTGEMSMQTHQDGTPMTVFQQAKRRTYFRNFDLNPLQRYDDELLAHLADELMKDFQKYQYPFVIPAPHPLMIFSTGCIVLGHVRCTCMLEVAIYNILHKSAWPTSREETRLY